MTGLEFKYDNYFYRCKYSNKEGVLSYYYIECCIAPTFESMDILLAISRLITSKYYGGEHIQGELKVVSKNTLDENQKYSRFILESDQSNKKDDNLNIDKIENSNSSCIAVKKLLNESRNLQQEKGCPFITDNELIELLKKFKIYEKKIN